MNPIRIVLADDHALVRAGIRTLCESLDGVTVVAEAADGIQVLEMIKAHHPDLVLMDITMKTLNGLEAAAQIKRDFPQVGVIILSMHAAEEYVQQALKAGAAGYLLKDAAVPELETAITAVMRGEVYLSPQISRLVVQSYMLHAGAVEGPLGVLTPRQREILQLIAEGHSTKDIGFRLSLSVKTVEAHRTQIMERLRIHDIAGLVRFAIRVGLVSTDN
ncbi:MAG: response regulator transcription factor [Betaproteobacteria bacterium]|nr:response regulator transcription factor [Betaproteobacteria bacterium]MBI2294341.1 response regulator transcription factor [Betaproteobacteria bacterium]MBI3056650.1 response regulator transcription factor [Betaproteobacteria bacterium]